MSRPERLGAKTPRRLAALPLERPGKRRHECGTHGAFGEEIAQEGWKTSGRDEGIGLHVGAEHDGHGLIADEAEQAARERGQPDETRRAGQSGRHDHAGHGPGAERGNSFGRRATGKVGWS